MFLSKACASVTSLDTTNAFTGCFSSCPIDCANWFVSLAPTTLKAAGVDVALLGAEILVPPPPFPVGVLTDVICLTVAIPEATAAAAAIPPSTGPTIGMPAKELKAD